ncbi:MAG: GGDEF domain-containing protein, partial [Oscillospiraceae bacterium]|nr:GGDEF domain-containing protein [Oscillospiraceae bacterium]
NGNIIIDTYDKKLENIEDLKTRKYDKGYSYERLINEERGNSVFQSKTWNEKMYIHYSPLEISDWKIMLARRRTHVFAKANYIVRILYTALLFFAVILGAYFFLLMMIERRKKRVTAFASQIRKFLLEANQQHASIEEALERMVTFGNARSAVFADTDAEEYTFILPEHSKKMLTSDKRNYFLNEIFAYAAEVNLRRKKSLNVVTIEVDSSLEKSNPKFCEFLKEQKIKSVIFASITNTNNQISILCVINPQKMLETKTLLADIAVCFSIAIFNKKHLKKTELAASTDSLTGLLNRVTYKRDIKMFDEQTPENFACVYVDVNELHLMNNKFGHAAGDEMLIYIANTLKEVFFGNKIYRMGGDEFLVLLENTDQATVSSWVDLVSERIAPKNYHVAIGMSFRTRNTDTEELVREAEIRMYEEKAEYYQTKENERASDAASDEYDIIRTGIDEVDTLLTAVKARYNGIYRVNLITDEVKRILMPAYLGYDENEKAYSRLFKKYVEETVHQDFQRAMFSFLNYESIKHQLAQGNTPRIVYKKKNSEMVSLTVHLLECEGSTPENTLWIFEKN